MQSSNYTTNLNVIANFAKITDEEKAVAAIKADGGVLTRADGYVAKLFHAVKDLWNRDLGGHFQETVSVIKDVSETTFKNISVNIDDLQKVMLKDDKRALYQQLSILKENLSHEWELMEGIKKIQEVYQQRYGKEKEHPGLKELESLYNEVESKVKEQTEAYLECISELSDTTSLTESFMQVSSKGDPSKSLTAFCQASCSGISVSQARLLISEGQQLTQDFFIGTKPPTHDPETSQKELTALCWFLMKCALTKNEGHAEGAFMIEDPHQRLYQFLLRSPGVGERDSSHLSGRSPKKHHGIDVLKGLPANKRTILFEMANNPSFRKDLPPKILFLKLENFSPFITTAYGYDMTMHGYELIVAQYNKKFHPGHDDQPNMRKERVPANILKEFAAVVKSIKEEIESFGGSEALAKVDPTGEVLDLDKAVGNAKKWGIEYIHHFLQDIKKVDIYPADFDKTTSPLEKEINALDHPDRRTGREVYLTEEEIAKAISAET